MTIKASYELIVKTDTGYRSHTMGQCTEVQYGRALAALHGKDREWVGLTDEETTREKRMTRLDSTGAAAVDHNYFWQPITTCPMGIKVQLLGSGGVAMYGTYNGKEKFYTHWAPLPKLAKG